jgi:tetratricopeptide (TPR) repeat protein
MLFCMALCPALALIFFQGGILAERFLYVPTLGFSIVAAYLAATLSQVPIRTPRADWRIFWGATKFSVPIALILSLYALKTMSRNTVWRDNMSLFSNGVTTSPGSCQTHRHYGSELINASVAEKDPRKRLEWFVKGTSQLRAALAIYPNFADAWFKLGVAYQLVAMDFNSAILCYNRAIQAAPQAPGSAGTYNNLGIIFEKLNKQELASFYFNRALAVNPYLPDAAANHQRHMKKTGLNVRDFPAASNPAPADKAAAERDSQAMSRVLWGL